MKTVNFIKIATTQDDDHLKVTVTGDKQAEEAIQTYQIESYSYGVIGSTTNPHMALGFLDQADMIQSNEIVSAWEFWLEARESNDDLECAFWKRWDTRRVSQD